MLLPLPERALHRLAAASGALLLAAPQLQAQGAWTRAEGETYLQFSLQRIGPYDEVFQDHGPDFIPGRELTQTSLETYIEHGLSADWTLVGTLALQALDAGSTNSNASILPTTINSGTETALGNLTLGLRHQLQRGTYSWASQLSVELPTGSTDRSTGLSTGLDAITFSPSVSVGRGFERAYVQAYAGLALRTDNYSHDWRVGVESGYRLDRWLLAGSVDVVSAFSGGSPAIDASQAQTALYVDEQEYVGLGIKGSYELSPNMALNLAARFAASGNNVPKVPFLSLGISMRW